jgi:hypothetical protein
MGIRLNVFENRMLRRIFEPKGMKVTRGKGKIAQRRAL